MYNRLILNNIQKEGRKMTAPLGFKIQSNNNVKSKKLLRSSTDSPRTLLKKYISSIDEFDLKTQNETDTLNSVNKNLKRRNLSQNMGNLDKIT